MDMEHDMELEDMGFEDVGFVGIEGCYLISSETCVQRRIPHGDLARIRLAFRIYGQRADVQECSTTFQCELVPFRIWRWFGRRFAPA